MVSVTSAKSEEENLNLLALGEQLNEVKLEGDCVNTILRGWVFTCN